MHMYLSMISRMRVCHPSRESQEAQAGRKTDKRKTVKDRQSMTAGMGNKVQSEGEHVWKLSEGTSPEWIRTWRLSMPLSTAKQQTLHLMTCVYSGKLSSQGTDASLNKHVERALQVPASTLRAHTKKRRPPSPKPFL